MDRILIKPGVYKKVIKKKSPDNFMKKRIKNAQENIDLLEGLRPPQRFRLYHDDDLRPRLRKSMLVRELENAEKKLICSTPHHTNDKNNEFIRKNFSVLLSPITFSRLSSEKRESVNEKKDQKNVSDSSEIRSTNSKNVTLSENAQDQQNIRRSLRISRRSQSINKSKIDNKSNQDPKNSNTSFNSHEPSRLKETGKSPAKILAKSPVKTPQVQEVAVKRTRIPVRTASQEKAKALESNNNLLASLKPLPNQDHKDKSPTPRKTPPETRSFSKNRSINKKTVTEDVAMEQPMGGCKDFLIKSPQKSSKQVGKASSPMNKHNHDQGDDEDVIVISSSCSTNFEASNGEDVEKNNIITAQSDNQTDRFAEKFAEPSNHKLERDRTEFVNKTPRRRNNETLSSQDQHSALCNKTANIPRAAIMAPSQCENPDVVQNKADEGESSEIVTQSVYMGLNKLGEPEILQNTPLQKSVAIQLSPNELLDTTLQNINTDTAKNVSPNPLNNLLAEITARRSALNGEIQSPVSSTGQNNECVATSEVGNTNPLSNIFAHIPARERFRSQECQTSMTRRRGSGRKQKFIRLEDFRCIPPVAAVPILDVPTPNRSNVISFGCGPDSDTNSSSGRGSHLCEAALNYVDDNRQSRFQIFESLEEDNIVDDALNFSDSEYGQHFHLCEESNRPWRFSSDDVVPELPLTFRRPKDFSCDNNDSASTLCPRNKTLLRPRESTAVTEELQRDTDTVIKTGRKKYAKKSLKIAEEPVNPLIQTVSSPTTSYGSASLRPSSSDNNDVTSLGLRNKAVLRPRDPTTTLNASNKTGKKIHNHKNTKLVEEPINPLKPAVSSPTISRTSSNENLSLRVSSSDNDCRSPKATSESSRQRSEAVGVKSPGKRRLTSTKNGEYSEKSPEPIEEPVHHAKKAVSLLTINRTLVSEAAVTPSSENLSLVASPQQSESIPKRHAEESCVSKALTRSRKDKIIAPVGNDTLTSCENLILSISSADQQLLGIRPLSTVASNRAVETGEIDADSGKTGKKVDKGHKSTRRQGNVQEIPNIDSGTEIQENSIQRRVVDSDINRTSPQRNKSNKKRVTKSDTKRLGTRCNINERNILPVIDGGRPQRTRTPMRLLSDMVIDESIILEWAKKGLKRGGKRKKAGDESVKKPKATKPRPGKGRSKILSRKLDEIPENVQDELVVPENSQTSASNKSPKNLKNNGDSIAARQQESESVPTDSKRPWRVKNNGDSIAARQQESESVPTDSKRPWRVKNNGDSIAARQQESESVPTDSKRPWRVKNNGDSIAARQKESESVPTDSKRPRRVKNNGDSIAARQKESESVPTDSKRPRRGRSQNKTNTTKTTTQTTTEAGDQNEGVEMPETSRVEDRTPLESDLVENNGDSIAEWNKESESAPTDGKRPRRGRSQNKTNTTKTTTQITTAGDQNEVVVLPESSRVEDRAPLESDLVGNLPLPREQVSQPLDNESMPPPKRKTINSTRKKRNNRILTGDSGIETSNINNTNKNLRNLSNDKTRGTSMKTNPTNRGDANVDQASQEFSLPDQPETDSFPNPVSTTEPSPSNSNIKDGTRKKQRVSHDEPEDVPTSARTQSGTSRFLERSVMSERTPDVTTVDVVHNNEYISYTKDNRLYSLKFCNNLPSDTDYKRFGNFDVTQPVKYKDNYSCGHIRIPPGTHKQHNIATKYSLIYNVMFGSAFVQCHNKTSTVEPGGFFVIPVGFEYSIKNNDSQRELVMSYTKIKHV